LEARVVDPMESINLTEVASPRGRRDGLRGVSTDIIWSVAAEGVTAVMAVVSFKLLASRLGKATYGGYAGFYGLISLMTALSSTWVSLVVVQVMAEGKENRQRAMASCYSLLLAVASIGAVIATTIGLLFFHQFEFKTVVFFVLAELFGTSTMVIVSAAAQVVVSVPALARIRMGQVILRTACVASVSIGGRASLRLLADVFFIAFTVYAALLVVYMRRRAGIHVRPGRIDPAHFKQGLVYAGSNVSGVLMDDADKTLMVTFGHQSDNGLYAAGYKVIQMGILPLRAIVTATHVRFFKSDEGEPNAHIKRSVRISGVAVAYAVVFVLAAVLMSRTIVGLIAKEYLGAGKIVQALAPIVLLRSTSYFAFNGLMGLGKFKTRLVIDMCSAFMAVLGYLLFIPSLSYKGAIIATYMGDVTFAVLSWTVLFYFQRKRNDEIAQGPLSVEPMPTEVSV
jgi:O-antigen/teichoic acid export membrane protein